MRLVKFNGMLANFVNFADLDPSHDLGILELNFHPAVWKLFTECLSTYTTGCRMIECLSTYTTGCQMIIILIFITNGDRTRSQSQMGRKYICNHYGKIYRRQALEWIQTSKMKKCSKMLLGLKRLTLVRRHFLPSPRLRLNFKSRATRSGTSPTNVSFSHWYPTSSECFGSHPQKAIPKVKAKNYQGRYPPVNGKLPCGPTSLTVLARTIRVYQRPRPQTRNFSELLGGRIIL